MAISMLPHRIGGGEQARQSEEGGAVDGDGEGAEPRGVPPKHTYDAGNGGGRTKTYSSGCSLDMDSWCATPTHPHI